MAAGDPKVFGMGVGKDEANKPQGIHELEDTGNTVAPLCQEITRPCIVPLDNIRR